VKPFTAIDHVQLAMPAGREDDARAFFCGVLGMTELPKPAELAGRGGCWFAEFVAAQKAHPGLRCTDLAALLQRLHEAGIAYEEDGATGSRRAFVRDPFGNRIELVG